MSGCGSADRHERADHHVVLTPTRPDPDPDPDPDL